ncbi:MAG: SprB repeat-containing protein, partial [Cyclobacteriaceae bacterium]
MLIHTASLKGIDGFSFEPVTITGQKDVTVFYQGDVEIILDFLEFDYDGNINDLILTVIEGDGYTFDGNTVTATIDYQNTWPARGQEITVNVQLSDGVDQSEVFEMKILVIPPILALSYNENSCQGTISLTASAYKPFQQYEGSFPFTFRLFDSEENLLEEVEVTNATAGQSSALATFGSENGLILDRQEAYSIVVEDALGRTYSRNAGPLGEAYSLDFELNFSGFVCANDPTGLIEFIVYNAALPLQEYKIINENGDEVSTRLDIVGEIGGGIVVQAGRLGAGKYILELSDQFDCNGSKEFEINIPGPLLAEPAIQEISCPNANDGSISLFIEGGWSQPFDGNPKSEWSSYSIEWFDENGESLGSGDLSFVEENGETVGMETMLNGLGPGDYYADIRDRGRLTAIPDEDPIQCILTSPIFTIEGPEPITLNSQFEPIACFGESNGQITIDPTGG